MRLVVLILAVLCGAGGVGPSSDPEGCPRKPLVDLSDVKEQQEGWRRYQAAKEAAERSKGKHGPKILDYQPLRIELDDGQKGRLIHNGETAVLQRDDGRLVPFDWLSAMPVSPKPSWVDRVSRRGVGKGARQIRQIVIEEYGRSVECDCYHGILYDKDFNQVPCPLCSGTGRRN